MKYTLVESNFSTVPQGSYRAVVTNRSSVDLSHIVKAIVKEGTGLTRPQAMAYSEKIFQIIEQYLTQGYRVNLPLASLSATIGGVFTGPDDQFHPDRHRINIRLVPGPRLSALRNTLKIEKESSQMRIPTPQVFVDVSGHRLNQTSPGSLAIIKGVNLKFTQDDAQQGVFFVSVTDPSKTEKVSILSTIKSTELHFLVPTLPAGYYYVEVRSTNIGLSSRRSGSLDFRIEVL